MIQVGSYEVPAEDWELTPANVRALIWKLVKDNGELKEKVGGLET